MFLKNTLFQTLVFQNIVLNSISIVNSKRGHKYGKMFKEEVSIEISKIIGLINNIEEYQKIYNHV